MKIKSEPSQDETEVVVRRGLVQCARRRAAVGPRGRRAVRPAAPIGREDPVRAGAESRAAADRQRLLGQEERRGARKLNGQFSSASCRLGCDTAQKPRVHNNMNDVFSHASLAPRSGRPPCPTKRSVAALDLLRTDPSGE